MDRSARKRRRMSNAPWNEMQTQTSVPKVPWRLGVAPPPPPARVPEQRMPMCPTLMPPPPPPMAKTTCAVPAPPAMHKQTIGDQTP
eukprot:5259102-Amphidinium_carterae.1